MIRQALALLGARRRTVAPAWNPATQFSQLIFWVDAKQAVSGVDYDASTKDLISWADKATGNDLVPTSNSKPVFNPTGLKGSPAFEYLAASAPVDCALKNAQWSDFSTGFGYAGPIFRSYVVKILSTDAFNCILTNIEGVGHSQIDGGPSAIELAAAGPGAASLSDPMLLGHFTSGPIARSAWCGPIIETDQELFLVIVEGRTTADGAYRSCYLFAPAANTKPGFFAKTFATDAVLTPTYLYSTQPPIAFGPNDANSTLDLAELVLALDDPATGGLLTNVDTMAEGQLRKWDLIPKELLLCAGDSLTGGSSGGFNLTQGQYWPYLASQINDTKDFVNVAVDSRTALLMQDDVTWLQPLKRPFGVQNTVLIWAGTNDIDADGSSAAGSYTHLSDLVALYKNDGWKVIVMTCIPRNWEAFGSGGGGSDAERNAFNGFVVGNAAGADQVIDLTQNGAFNSDSSWNDLTNYQTDGIHLTPAGQIVIAGIVAAAL